MQVHGSGSWTSQTFFNPKNYQRGRSQELKQVFSIGKNRALIRKTSKSAPWSQTQAQTHTHTLCQHRTTQLATDRDTFAWHHFCFMQTRNDSCCKTCSREERYTIEPLEHKLRVKSPPNGPEQRYRPLTDIRSNSVVKIK